MHIGKKLKRFIEVELAPPHYLSLPTVGIDISSSAIKIVSIVERMHGLELGTVIEQPLPQGSVEGGEVADKAGIAAILETLAHRHHIERANISLPETRGYLFEANVDGVTPDAIRTGIEKHIDEYVPLPPQEVTFDNAILSQQERSTHIVGIGYARRAVDELLLVAEGAGVEVRAIESETFALARALLPLGSVETVLIIDIGKSSTKLVVVSNRIPRLATTIDVGGYALTLAIQKYFGVTEEEAKKVKAERGLVPSSENDEYIAAMISTVSVIREEIKRRIDYWDSRKALITDYEPITRALVVGGNATVRGLPEYLETELQIPVELGDVFTNLASRDEWLPPMDYTESLAFGTAIGLALREYTP